MGDNLHKGHRKRVKARFIKDGNLDSFEYHQILELLLFYAIPMKDTNEMAHKLLNEYGSFHNLLNASPEDLMKRCKVTENAAVLISMIPHLSRRYLNSAWDKNVRINSLNIASEYFNSLLAGEPYESFYMLCLDVNKRLIKAVKISEGNVGGAHIYIDKVVDWALLYKTSYVLIGHNHPSGTMKPSKSDVDATEKIKLALDTINMLLLDHIIVCGQKNYSFAENRLCNLKY